MLDLGLQKVVNLGKTIGSGIISLATGIPFAGDILSGITRFFENRNLGVVIDEFGNVYDPKLLIKQMHWWWILYWYPWKSN